MKKYESYKYITFADRRHIERWYEDGVPVGRIADRVNVAKQTIYRELKRGYTGENYADFRPAYSANLAQSKVTGNISRRGGKDKYRPQMFNKKKGAAVNETC